MALNVGRFEKDLNNLLILGGKLEKSFAISCYGKDKFFENIELESGDLNKILDGLPSFNISYEEWYSEALAVIKQLLPDRLQDFKNHFEAPHNRKELDYISYRISDSLKGTRVTIGGEVKVDKKAGLIHFQQQLAILLAAKKRFESSLFDIKQLVQADLFDSEIDSARELLRKKFLRGAGAIAGVVLEKHLRQTCENHNIEITKKHPTLSDLNELLKANSIIDFTQWRHITLLADYRNLCDHNKQKEPTVEQVTELIDGTDKILKTIA